MGSPQLITIGLNDESSSVLFTDSHPDIRGAEVSPDGNRIAYWTKSGIWIINADGSDPRRILPINWKEPLPKGETRLGVSSPSWYPDGEYLIYEHYRVTRTETGIDGTLTEGYLSFYKVHVDSALMVSTLP
ncbi:MAG: hypothetical protein B6244_10835 [Candidatus Cloacimonetes bacterium 4572_55]|nr:MAG: hypothetical protein B6244_10835 [Candidatus Cloacimonetes bacterium 4572_55]